MTQKVSAMTEATALDTNDLVYVVDISAGSAGSKKITTSNLLSTLIAKLASSDIPWAKVDKTGSALSDLASRAGTSLTASKTDILLGRETAGSGAIEEIDCTSTARTLISKSTVADMLTFLGVDAESNGWSQLSATFSHVEEYYNGTSFVAVSDWAPSTAYTTGDIVAETVDKTYFQEATDSFTSSTTEPTWNNIGSYSDEPDLTGNEWFARGRHVLAIDTDLTGTIKEGMAIKYKYAALPGYHYGKVVGINSSRIALATNYLVPATAISEVYLGNTEKVQQIEIYLEGQCGNNANAYCSRITAFDHPWYRWLLSTAYLVQMGYIAADVDLVPSIEDLHINVSVDGTGGSPVFLDTGILASYQGVYPAATYKITDYGSATTAGNIITFNKDIVILKNTSSDGITTSDLFITLVFVLE